MPKKEPTAKQLAARKAAGERMRAMHAAKKAQKEGVVSDEAATTVAQVDVNEIPQQTVAAPPEERPVPEEAPVPQPAPVAPAVTMSPEQFQMLLERFGAMANEKPKTGLEKTGIIERFPVTESAYKNPVEELMDLPKFSRFSMRDNYVIEWKVTQTKYETRQGQWYVEPRFELTLKRKQLDDDGNELVRHDKLGKPFHPRVILGRASFFVDPPADLIEAEAAGLEDAGLSDDDMRERMQFWRYQMWIDERLNPKRPAFTTNAIKEEVIAGKAYQIEEYSEPV